MNIDIEEIWFERKRSALQYLARSMCGKGYRFSIKDGDQPCITYLYGGTALEITLPIRTGTAANFLFGRPDSRKIYFVDTDAVSSAMLMHELAHFLNTEPSTILRDTGQTFSNDDMDMLSHKEIATIKQAKDCIPAFITNMINDVNDYTFIPSNWEWAAPYMQYLTDLYTFSRKIWTKKRTDDSLTRKEKEAGLSDYEIELQRALSLFMVYLRTLRFRYDARIVRNIDQDDRLYEDSLKIAAIVKSIRPPWADYNTRVKAAIDLYDLLLNVWTRNGGPDREEQENQQNQFMKALKEMLEEMMKQILSEPGEGEGKNKQGKGEGEGLPMPLNAGIPTPGKSEAAKEEGDENPSDQLQEIDKPAPLFGGTKNGFKDDDKIDVLKEALDKMKREGNRLDVDISLARRIAQVIQQKLSERTNPLYHSYREKKSKKLTLKRVVDVFTERDKPRLWKKLSPPKDKRLDLDLCTIFDKSGSMSGTPGELSRKIGCTLLFGLWNYPGIEYRVVCFGSPSTTVFKQKPAGMDESLNLLYHALEPEGGTDLVHALRNGLDMVEKSNAKKKVVFITNDGDFSTTDSFYRNKECFVCGHKVSSCSCAGENAKELCYELTRAKRAGVHVLFFNMNGAADSRINHPHYKSINVDNIYDLPTLLEERLEELI